MRCEEAREFITAYVDNELSVSERPSLETHLKDCPKCQFNYGQEQALKREIRSVAATLRAPADLRDKILSDRRIFPQRPESLRVWRGLILPSRPVFHPVFVLALLVLLLLPTLYLARAPEGSISLSALETHEKIVRGDISFVKATNQEGIKEQLLRSVEGKFAPMGYDLSMMNLGPVGGVIQDLRGRKILVTIYEGKAPSLTCYTFLGTERDAPSDAALFFDPNKKINFYAFSREGVNGVLHREGRLICILVSRMPMQDLLALARSKAQPAPSI